MKVCPFTGEKYQGEIVKSKCDSCNTPVTYEQCAYGTDWLILCGKSRCLKD